MTEKRIARGPEGGLDFRALKGAIQGRDPGALLGFYAEDAELRVVNPAHPAARPSSSGAGRRSGSTCAPSATGGRGAP